MDNKLYENDGCEVFLRGEGRSLVFNFDNYDKNNNYHMLRYALQDMLIKFGGKTKITSHLKLEPGSVQLLEKEAHKELLKGGKITELQLGVPPKGDVVHNPSHYTSHPSGVECIDIVKHMNFPLGSAMKYIWRAGLKDDRILDLRKAKEYIDIELKRLEEVT